MACRFRPGEGLDIGTCLAINSDSHGTTHAAAADFAAEHLPGRPGVLANGGQGWTQTVPILFP